MQFSGIQRGLWTTLLFVHTDSPSAIDTMSLPVPNVGNDAVVRAPASALLSILLSRTAQAVLAGCRPLLTLLSVSVCRHSSGTSNFNNGGTNVAYNPQWASTKSGGASQNCAFQASHHTEA